MRCLLKPGGLFFLGLPGAARDLTLFNGHRYYAVPRWSLLGAGFRLLDWFTPAGVVSSYPDWLATRIPKGVNHIVAVFQKI